MHAIRLGVGSCLSVRFDFTYPTLLLCKPTACW